MEILKRYLINILTKHLLPVVKDEEIVSFNKFGKVFVDGKELNDAEIQNLRAEVRFLEDSRIWQLIHDYFDHLAKKKIYEEASDMTGLLFGKSILYTLEVQKTIIKNIKNVKIAK